MTAKRRTKKDVERERPRRDRERERRPSSTEIAEYHAGVGEAQADMLYDIRELLMMMLACQVCPHCSGTGVVKVDAVGDGDKAPPSEACECRLRACGLLGELIRDKKDAEREELEDDPDRECRECGCTEERACKGGCEWVEEDLCSACVDE